MYVARLRGDDGYIVKRMPEHRQPARAGLPVLRAAGRSSPAWGRCWGSAITEDPATGETTLKLDFPLTKIAGRSAAPAADGDSDSVASGGTKLSLRGLLHYLWDQAELTRWHPGFAGKRTWGTVRSHLLQRGREQDRARRRAARPALRPGDVLGRGARRDQRAPSGTVAARGGGTRQAAAADAADREVKEIVPARYGYKAVIKHVPDQPFAVDEQLYRRLGRRFERELSLWGVDRHLHMVMMGTFGVDNAGIPAIADLTLMP